MDEDGDVIDILVQSRSNRRAASRFFRKLLKGQGRESRLLITDQLRSHAAAHRTAMPSVVHRTRQYKKNRAELSHQPTRQRERHMRRFTSAAHLHASRRSTASCRISSGWAATYCKLFTTGCCEPRRSSRGMRRRAPADRARALRAEGENHTVFANFTVPPKSSKSRITSDAYFSSRAMAVCNLE